MAHPVRNGILLFVCAAFICVLAYDYGSERGYDSGFWDGYDLGYGEGGLAGLKEAREIFYMPRYNEGLEDGRAQLEKVKADSYAAGLSAGQSSTVNEAYHKGYSEGYDAAYNEIEGGAVTNQQLPQLSFDKPLTDEEKSGLAAADAELARSESPSPAEPNQTTLADIYGSSASSSDGDYSEPRVIPSQETSINPNYITVYITDSGGCYHRGDCHHLKSRQEKKLSEVMGDYAPCIDCRPPYYTGS